jgi:chromosome segregation ATPase
MSQLETIMLVTLGFVLAALLAMFLGRLIWSYAVTLGKRRTERSAPATIAALKAERDQLRAESAMMSRKLELRLDDLKTRLAEQTAEVSRNRNRIDHLIEELEKRNATIAERDEQIAELGKQFEPLEIELATRTQAMQQLKEQLRDHEEASATANSNHFQFQNMIAERDREIAALRAELTNMPRHEEITTQAQSAQQRLQSQIAELTALSQQIERQRSDLSQEVDLFARLQAQNVVPEPEPEVEQEDPKPIRKKSARKSARIKAKGRAKARESQLEVKQEDADTKVKTVREQETALEEQIRNAERETDELQDELQKLDALWAEKISDLNKAAADTIGKRARSADKASNEQTDEPSTGRNRQNVISLAARIRALQRKSAEN